MTWASSTPTPRSSTTVPHNLPPGCGPPITKSDVAQSTPIRHTLRAITDAANSPIGQQPNAADPAVHFHVNGGCVAALVRVVHPAIATLVQTFGLNAADAAAGLRYDADLRRQVHHRFPDPAV